MEGFANTSRPFSRHCLQSPMLSWPFFCICRARAALEVDDLPLQARANPDSVRFSEKGCLPQLGCKWGIQRCTNHASEATKGSRLYCSSQRKTIWVETVGPPLLSLAGHGFMLAPLRLLRSAAGEGLRLIAQPWSDYNDHILYLQVLFARRQPKELNQWQSHDSAWRLMQYMETHSLASGRCPAALAAAWIVVEACVACFHMWPIGVHRSVLVRSDACVEAPRTSIAM